MFDFFSITTCFLSLCCAMCGQDICNKQLLTHVENAPNSYLGLHSVRSHCASKEFPNCTGKLAVLQSSLQKEEEEGEEVPPKEKGFMCRDCPCMYPDDLSVCPKCGSKRSIKVETFKGPSYSGLCVSPPAQEQEDSTSSIQKKLDSREGKEDEVALENTEKKKDSVSQKLPISKQSDPQKEESSEDVSRLEAPGGPPVEVKKTSMPQRDYKIGPRKLKCVKGLMCLDCRCVYHPKLPSCPECGSNRFVKCKVDI